MKSILKLELVWFAFTFIVMSLVMIPIWRSVPEFPFHTYNIIFIIVAITIVRHIFLLKHTTIAKSIPIKLVIIFLTIPALVLLIDGLAEFQSFLDYEGYESFLGHLSTDRIVSMGNYIRTEYFIFGVTSVLSTAILFLRMIISIFRQLNRGTV